MSFRQCRKRRIICRRRFVVANTAAIVLLLECMLVSSLLSTSFFCNGNKNPSAWSSDSSSSFWKLPKPSTATTKWTTPVVLLGTTSDQNQIAAWVTQQRSRRNLPHSKRTSLLLPCAGYYIPSPTTMGSRRRNSVLFSRKGDETDNGDYDKDYNQRNGNDNMKKSKEMVHTKGLLSILGNFKYGVNRVNKDFLGLTWKVYSQTFLWMAPFVVLLFVILPLWSKSSSPFFQLLAIQVQGFLKRTFEVLAEGSRFFFVRPMHGLAQLIVNWCSTGSASAANNSVWKTRSSRKSMLLWGLFWGPVLEEFIFRFAFRGLWKVLFRPISIGTENSTTSNSADTQIIKPDTTMMVLPLSFATKILSDFRKTLTQEHQQPRYTNRNWRIASGICFGIAHFSNFFPIDPSQYTMDGEIRLPSGTVRERFLLSLFPGDFASQSANKEFCLVSMVLAGAIYQALHCFINTVILYGPLLDSPRSKKGGIFAAIGAHIAWNANVLWLVSNLKLRVVVRLVSLKLVSRYHQKENRKRQDRVDQEESEWQ